MTPNFNHFFQACNVTGYNFFAGIPEESGNERMGRVADRVWETLDLSEKMKEVEDDEELLRDFVKKDVDSMVLNFDHDSDLYEQKTEEMINDQRLLTKIGKVM